VVTVEQWQHRLLEAAGQDRWQLRPEGYHVREGLERREQENPYREIDYSSASHRPHTTTSGEWPCYIGAVRRLLQLLPASGLVVDLGSGDGRLSQFLLESTTLDVVSLDIDEANVSLSASRLLPRWRRRWLGLVEDIQLLTLPPACCDAMLAMGVLNLFKPRLVPLLETLAGLLRPGGLLLDAEPTLEGALLYAVARRSVGQFLLTARTATKTTDFDRSDAPTVPVFDSGEMEAALEQAGLELVERHPVSVLPSLVYGGWFHETPPEQADRVRIGEALEQLVSRGSTAARAMIFISRRPR